MQLKDNLLRSYNYGAGVIVGRFQVHTLHQEQKKIIEYVGMNHNRVIVFIGVSRTPPTKRNPLDFMSRKAMIKQVLPEATVIPIQDNRSNKEWSETLDYNISMSLPANTKPLLYGGRHSFIPHYEGRFKTAEVVGDFHTHSGTASREEVSRNPPSFNSDFRAGVINSVYNRYSITYTTVDICAHNNEGQILLARKPSEDKFRFVGGFVDTDDESLEVATKREFEEETGEDEMVLYFDGSNKEKPFGEGMDDYFIDVRNRIRTQWDSMPLDLTDGDNRYPATDKVLQKRIELLKKYASKKNVKNYK